MPAPINGMTFSEAAAVARATGRRIRREGEISPLKWYHRRGQSLWLYQEDDGAHSVVLSSQYTADDFTTTLWTILAPDEPPPPDPCPAGFHWNPITLTCDPDGDDPDDEDDGGGGGNDDDDDGGGGDDDEDDGGDGDEPPLPPLPPGPDDPPQPPNPDKPPFPPLPDNPPPYEPPDEPHPPCPVGFHWDPEKKACVPNDRPNDHPAPSPNVTNAGVSCTSGGLAWTITGAPTPPGMAYSVVLLCDLGHTHGCGVLIGSIFGVPQTLSGEIDPHDCCGGSFRLNTLVGPPLPPVVVPGA